MAAGGAGAAGAGLDAAEIMNGGPSRRRFLQVAGWGAASAAAAALTRQAFAQGKTRPPNIVLILTDDQGSIDVNCYGSDDLHTPHLDRLGQEGVRFTQFYVGAPVCSASRACLLTGRYPQRAELPSNAGGQQGMPGRQVTIAEMLKPAGYRTACFGKWHLGEQPDMLPNAQGFDEFFGHVQGCIDNYSHFFYWSGPNRHDLWRDEREVFEDGLFFPDLVVREAHRFMDENRDRPFFMYLPFNVPHYPLQPYERHRRLYRGMGEPRESYAAFVTTLDEKIGEVVSGIDALGLREDTVIIYLSDHGHSVEERTNYGGGNAGPYRGHKFTVWEGGIRVPCMISWPGRLPQNEVRGQMTHAADWLPTIADYAGVETPDRPLDGRNMRQIIDDPAAPSAHEVLHWEFGDQWAVRRGPWKLVKNGWESEVDGDTLPAAETFLAHLEEDPGERHNLAGERPDLVQEFTALHEDWAEDVELQS
jgi:arylsulfatase A-like enzyme